MHRIRYIILNFRGEKTGNKVVFRACAAILFVDFEKGANINKAIKLKILVIFERKNRQIIVVVSNSNILCQLHSHFTKPHGLLHQVKSTGSPGSCGVDLTIFFFVILWFLEYQGEKIVTSPCGTCGQDPMLPPPPFFLT